MLKKTAFSGGIMARPDNIYDECGRLCTARR